MRDVARQHPSPMLAIQPVFPETSFFENMMGDLKWVFIKCKSVGRCYLFVSFVSKKICFWAPARKCRNHELMNHTSQQEGKTYAARGGGWVIFSRLAWGVKMSWTTERLSSRRTNFLHLLCGKKACGNLCWSLKCFEHQFFFGGYGRVGWGDGPILLTILNV